MLAVLAACGRIGFTPFWQSGTRLRAHLLVGDGDPIFIGWYDAMLGTDCQPAVSADGSERCMPLGEGDTWYADSACTQRLAGVYPGSCKHDTYVSAFVGGQAHAYPVLSTVFTGQAYRDVGGGSCVPDNPPAELHQVGSEVAPAMFVTSGYSTQVHGAYTEEVNVFGDGAREELRALTFDSGSCRPFANDLGSAPCRASTRRGEPVYLDGACTQPGLLWARQPDDPPQVTQLNVFPPQACDMQYDLYDVIADVTGPKYYTKDPIGCISHTTPPGAVLYTATKTTNPYPVGTVVRGPRRGRLGRLYWIAPRRHAVRRGHARSRHRSAVRSVRRRRRDAAMPAGAASGAAGVSRRNLRGRTARSRGRVLRRTAC